MGVSGEDELERIIEAGERLIQARKRMIEANERRRAELINSIIIDHALVNGLPASPDSVDRCARKIIDSQRIKTIDAILQKIYKTAIPIGFEEDEKTT